MTQLVIPTCSVSPAGGGTCSYTTTGSGTLPGLIAPAHRGEYQTYRYTATRSAGATFVGFDVILTGNSRNSSASPLEPFTKTTRWEGTQSGDSWIWEPDITNWGGGLPGPYWADAGYAIWEGWEVGPPDDKVLRIDLEITSISVVAVFSMPHIPTHLLVNSSTVESPAKLVYDPTTNLLVGDY